ncbi:Toll-interacting protein-like [Oopsacas minuta]|uniref:Toll-interacting protein-like n=1 Tax=Oopsacas minuta TaxID=111878 RepID=A0AAV7JQC4_9METZ|nr:Toll-interacting protein-like [Oopsacas minuta]
MASIVLDTDNSSETDTTETTRLTDFIHSSPVRKQQLEPDWREQLKKKAMLDVPDGFLRLQLPTQTPGNLQPVHYATTTTQPQNPYAGYQQYVGRLAITLAQARLNKNYGLTRMDPYCRLTIGHGVYETPTSLNGAKHPKWNKCIYVTLPNGITSFYIEIFDEKAFSVDERIAWAHIELPAAIFEGQAVEDWFPLNGNLGDGKEGTMLLGFKFERANFGSPPQQPPEPRITYDPPNMAVNQHSQRTALHSQPSTEGFKQLKDMFPDLEEEIIVSVLASQDNNTDNTINALLSMSTS